VVSKIAGAEEILEVFYEVGDYVEEGDLIVLLDTESTDDQVENARLAYVTAKRNYDALAESVSIGKANLVRTQALFDSGVASAQALENAKLQASDGQLKTVGSQLSQAKFAYDNAQEGLENTTIVAPISGVISAMGFEENNLATSQSNLMITSMDRFDINLAVTENIINKINDDTTIEVVLESDNSLLDSDLVSVNPVADARTGLYGLVVNVDNKDALYKPGMFVSVHFKFKGQDIRVIPIDAVLSDDLGEFVYLADNNSVIKKQVVTGADDGEIIEILSGLNDDDLVIVKGQNYITEETEIRIVTGGN
jgi:RND family efflux transporter MFP subunit